MATSASLPLRVAIALSLLLFLLPIYSTAVSSVEEEDEYILDKPYGGESLRSGRLLATVVTVKKGARCNVTSNNICNGVSANKGTSLLQCCKKHCRNILGDRNNCGRCGQKCRFGQLCCGGNCTNVGFNSSHCGKCNRACASGVKCEFGVCGYA